MLVMLVWKFFRYCSRKNYFLFFSEFSKKNLFLAYFFYVLLNTFNFVYLFVYLPKRMKSFRHTQRKLSISFPHSLSLIYLNYYYDKVRQRFVLISCEVCVWCQMATFLSIPFVFAIWTLQFIEYPQRRYAMRSFSSRFSNIPSHTLNKCLLRVFFK